MTEDLNPADRSALPIASVVVPTIGHSDLVECLLDALARQTLTPESFEVIVVADGATDGTVELVESYASDFRLRCISQPRGGRSAACNAGVRLATGTFVILLDDDMEPDPIWAQAHLDAHGTSPRRCVLGAVPVSARAHASPLEEWVRRGFDEHHKKLAEPSYSLSLRDFYSGNASIRRDVLIEVGAFDEDFATLYGNEDLELYVRLRAAGVEVTFSPAALAVQEYHKTFTTYARNTREAGRTAVLLARKHPEIAGELMQFRGGRGVWRRVNGVLLGASRRYSFVPGLVARLESVVARVVPRRSLSGFYWNVSNYFFWVGVNEAQSDAEILRR